MIDGDHTFPFQQHPPITGVFALLLHSFMNYSSSTAGFLMRVVIIILILLYALCVSSPTVGAIASV